MNLHRPNMGRYLLVGAFYVVAQPRLEESQQVDRQQNFSRFHLILKLEHLPLQILVFFVVCGISGKSASPHHPFLGVKMLARVSNQITEQLGQKGVPFARGHSFVQIIRHPKQLLMLRIDNR